MKHGKNGINEFQETSQVTFIHTVSSSSTSPRFYKYLVSANSFDTDKAIKTYRQRPKVARNIRTAVSVSRKIHSTSRIKSSYKPKRKHNNSTNDLAYSATLRNFYDSHTMMRNEQIAKILKLEEKLRHTWMQNFTQFSEPYSKFTIPPPKPNKPQHRRSTSLKKQPINYEDLEKLDPSPNLQVTAQICYNFVVPQRKIHNDPIKVIKNQTIIKIPTSRQINLIQNEQSKSQLEKTRNNLHENDSSTQNEIITLKPKITENVVLKQKERFGILNIKPNFQNKLKKLQRAKSEFLSQTYSHFEKNPTKIAEYIHKSIIQKNENLEKIPTKSENINKIQPKSINPVSSIKNLIKEEHKFIKEIPKAEKINQITTTGMAKKAIRRVLSKVNGETLKFIN